VPPPFPLDTVLWPQAVSPVTASPMAASTVSAAGPAIRLAGAAADAVLAAGRGMMRNFTWIASLLLGSMSER
jgi:hypothetical protein